MSEYTGIFKAKYGILQGKAWIRSLDPEDLRVFIEMGFKA